MYWLMEKRFLMCKKKKKKKTIIEISKNVYYTTGTLLDYEYFFKYYKLIEIYSSK